MTALSRIASPELGAARLLVVPLGATEQHGPHLPLTTDTEIVLALIGELDAAVTGIHVAPALAYGASGEHQAFPGTLSIGRDATTQVLVELGRSATETFERVLFACAHGGNAQALSDALGTLRGEGRDVRAWTPRWSGDAHAGRLETSLMLAIAPERVQLARAQVGNRAPVAELMPALRAGGVMAASVNGVLGDPTGASADEGRALLTAERERITQELLAWLGQ